VLDNRSRNVLEQHAHSPNAVAGFWENHFRKSTHPQLISFCISQSFFVDRAPVIRHHAKKQNTNAYTQ